MLYLLQLCYTLLSLSKLLQQMLRQRAHAVATKDDLRATQIYFLTPKPQVKYVYIYIYLYMHIKGLGFRRELTLLLVLVVAAAPPPLN